MLNLILASGSPRRKEMLQNFDINVDVRKPDILEEKRDSESLDEYVCRNALEKAEAIFSCLDRNGESGVILSGDTVVSHGGNLLEKPLGEDDAFRMLKLLSSSSHQVISGYQLLGFGQYEKMVSQGLVKTTVFFKNLSDLEIKSYIASGEPFDKAGGYGIQGLASYMVEKIEGSYSNVVGLPLTEVVQSLKEDFGVELTVRRH